MDEEGTVLDEFLFTDTNDGIQSFLELVPDYVYKAVLVRSNDLRGLGGPRHRGEAGQPL